MTDLADWLAKRFEAVTGLPPTTAPTVSPDTKTVSLDTKAQCGTISGYQMHRKLGVPICEDCQKGWAAYCRRWRKRNPGYYSRRSTT